MAPFGHRVWGNHHRQVAPAPSANLPTPKAEDLEGRAQMPSASVGSTRAGSGLLPAPRGPQPVLFPAVLVLQLLHLHSYSLTFATLASNFLRSLASPFSQRFLHLSNSCSPDAPSPLLLLPLKPFPTSSSLTPQALLIFLGNF